MTATDLDPATWLREALEERDASTAATITALQQHLDACPDCPPPAGACPHAARRALDWLWELGWDGPVGAADRSFASAAADPTERVYVAAGRDTAHLVGPALDRLAATGVLCFPPLRLPADPDAAAQLLRSQLTLADRVLVLDPPARLSFTTATVVDVARDLGVLVEYAHPVTGTLLLVPAGRLATTGRDPGGAT